MNIENTKKYLLILLFAICFTGVQAQNDLISLRSVSDSEYEIQSTNGLPFTIVLENSNNDGQYHLPSGGSTIFKTEDLIGNRSTLRIIFEKEMYHSLEDKLIEQYDSDVQWITNFLEIKEKDKKMFPTRPVFSDVALEKLKSKVFDYATTDRKEDYFNQWIEKINYSVGAVDYFRKLYAASNGENNEHRYNFEPINIHAALRR
ncbi:hypothetical protein J8281_17525 [Aquimarina sp. U1-2]|uniref:hypothetical protein n=1 Tax=Aquimarina sp. U1-2 TaxID=2823141 RepID=UPI001AECD40D|nr:hypothetical protein [Aquimarina sp. U1-2]MBP2834000.1 hypothetical protein [Aquimarina sp. U1-2]